MQKNIKAILFDCDGVLLDSEKKIKSLVHNYIKENYECSFDYEYFYTKTRGLSTKNTVEFLHNHNIIVDEKFTNYFNGYFSVDKYAELTEKMEHLDDVLKELSHLPKAVCSNGYVSVYRKALQKHGIDHHFNGFFGGDNVKNVKPSPDMFLQAAKHLNIAIEDCLVIDDSYLTGIPAGKASNAGAVVGFMSDEYSNKQDMLNAGADYAISNLKELTNIILNK